MKRPITKKQLEAKRKKAQKVSKQPANKFNEFAAKAFNANFNTEQDIKNLVKKPANRWGTYKGVISVDKTTQADERTQFECYCCGWLQYYDEIVRKESTDHTIWFDWNGSNCSIYLYPRPRTAKDAKNSLPAGRTTDPTNPTAPPPPY